MSNLEKYNKVFCETLDVQEQDLEGLTYQSIDQWDSVGHMNLISALEDTFEIMFDTDDVIDFNSYRKGKELLSSHYEIAF